MALTATIATFCAVTAAAIRWLVVLGLVRDYTVTRASGTLDASTSIFVHHIGLASGPSVALTNLDRLTWKLGLLAGILWMLRLALRSADHRIGVLRGFGVLSGFGVFVVTGVMHRVADAVGPVDARDRLDDLITRWCAAAVVAAGLVMATSNLGRASGAPALGVKALPIPIAWSIARGALQLGVVLGGWLLAATLTSHWIVRTERDTSRPGSRVGDAA
jgi:hypothetical protein